MAVKYGTTGSDNILGTLDQDTIYGWANADNATSPSGDDTLLGNDGNDILYGGTGNDSLNGGSGNDTLFGRTGNDTLDGGTGRDLLLGGTGNDTYLIKGPNDTIFEYLNGGIDRVLSSISYTLGDNLENLILTGTSAIDGTGNSLNNTIIGNTANNFLSGAGGNDFLSGGAGNDTLIADNSLDSIGDNTLSGGAGNDTLIVSLGKDIVDGGSGTDTLWVDYVNSTATIGISISLAGSTTIRTIIAGSSSVTFSSIERFDVTGTNYNDTLIGGNVNDYLSGALGNDLLFGEDGNDYLFGKGGNDYLFGGDGNDTIRGIDFDYNQDAGYDTLSGGVGADTFVLGTSYNELGYGGVAYLGSEHATITDFRRAEGDTFQVFGTTYSLSYSNFEVGTSNLDTGIFYGNALIAIVQDTTNVLYPTDFISVG